MAKKPSEKFFSVIAEEYIKMYYQIVNYHLIDEEKRKNDQDENIGGSKMSNPQSTENSIVSNLSNPTICLYQNVLECVREPLNALGSDDIMIIECMYSENDNLPHGRDSVRNVANILQTSPEVVAEVRKRLIADVAMKIIAKNVKNTIGSFTKNML